MTGIKANLFTHRLCGRHNLAPCSGDHILHRYNNAFSHICYNVGIYIYVQNSLLLHRCSARGYCIFPPLPVLPSQRQVFTENLPALCTVVAQNNVQNYILQFKGLGLHHLPNPRYSTSKRRIKLWNSQPRGSKACWPLGWSYVHTTSEQLSISLHR